MMRASKLYPNPLSLVTGVALLSVAALSSCTDHDYDYTKAHESWNSKQESFISQFTEAFTSISDHHVWTSLADGSVLCPTLEGATDAKLRIFTSNPRYASAPAYLLAEFDYEAGRRCLFQYPAGLQYLYATLDSGSQVTIYRFTAGLETEPAAVATIDAAQLPEIRKMRYILAAEVREEVDKQKNLDFDYNDCVLAVDFVQGQSTADLQVLCAGTIEGVKVTYMRGDNRSNPKDETIIDEVHAALGLPGYFDSWDKCYRYDIIGTEDGPNANQPVQQPTYTLRLNEGDQTPDQVLYRLCCLFGPEDKKDSDKQRVNLQIEQGFRLGQMLCIPDASWQWNFEGAIFSTSYTPFCRWVSDCTTNPFWYGGIWKFANRAEEMAQDPADIEYGCRLPIDSVHTYIDAEHLRFYQGYSATLTLVVSQMSYGATIQLRKYPNQAQYFSQTIRVNRAGAFSVTLSPLELNNICGASINGSPNTGIEIITTKCSVQDAFIR